MVTTDDMLAKLTEPAECIQYQLEIPLQEQRAIAAEFLVLVQVCEIFGDAYRQESQSAEQFFTL